MITNNPDMPDAMVDSYEAFRQFLTLEDFAALYATLGTSPAAMRDALKMLNSTPRYPLWRFAADIVMIVVLMMCTIVIIANDFLALPAVSLAVFALALTLWIGCLEQRWKRKHRMY